MNGHPFNPEPLNSEFFRQLSSYTKYGCQNPSIKPSVIPADGGLRGGKLLRESTSVLGDDRSQSITTGFGIIF